MKTLTELETEARPILTEREAQARKRRDEITIKIVRAIAEREEVNAAEFLPYVIKRTGFKCIFGIPGYARIEVWPCHRKWPNCKELKWQGDKLIGDYSWFVWTGDMGYHQEVSSLGDALVIAKDIWNEIHTIE